MNASWLLNLSSKEVDALPEELRDAVKAAREQVFAAKRLQRIDSARDSLLEYTQLMMPDPDNLQKSRYEVHAVHKYLAEHLEKVERGEILRLIINTQPRIGKSELATKKFAAWCAGRDPYRQIISTAYGDDLAKEFGRAVRDTMLTPAHLQVFPKSALKANSKSSSRLQTEAGGVLTFVGLGGAMTGKGADIMLIDDPIKNAQEARSQSLKDKQWMDYTQTVSSRLMGRGGAIVITCTRWAEDDLVGRLTNPELGYVEQQDADQWAVINIPALVETAEDAERDPFGRKEGEVLWEERTPLAFLESFRRMDPTGFAALYQGRPSPPEGNFFIRSHIEDHAYAPNELPRHLRYYGASDHAISLKQGRDSSVLGVAGLDHDRHLWVMPDVVWGQLESNDQVESMLQQMRKYNPILWSAEKGHISKSIGPYLRQRMKEERVNCYVREQTPIGDKMARAQAIQAMFSMGLVHLPKFAPWYSAAVDQLLKFPNDAHDDFVDFMAWLGLTVDLQIPRSTPKAKQKPIKTGTLAWVLNSEPKRPKHRMLN